MSRFITLLLLGFVAYTLYKRFISPPSRTPKQPDQSGEKICKCLYCQAHSPASRGITLSNGQFFCSAEHQRLYLTTQKQEPTE
ncbi:MAG TPA: hypothetical protein VFM46_03935 [Pseudomonadales bacterium]|nr:hypothetical protein [Pseudomonadales bacterium]